MNEKNLVAKVATPKVFQKTAKAWSTYSPARRAELKAILPLDELATAIVSRGLDMIDYLVRTNDEAARSEAEDQRARIRFYEEQLKIEENEDRRNYLFEKIDKASDAITLSYNQHRKDRLKIIYALTAGVTIVGIAFAKNGKIPK